MKASLVGCKAGRGNCCNVGGTGSLGLLQDMENKDAVAFSGNFAPFFGSLRISGRIFWTSYLLGCALEIQT